jgi:hypothetical protein
MVRFGRWPAGEQIFQIIERIGPMPPTTAQQGVNHGATLAGFRIPYEQKNSFSPERTGKNARPFPHNKIYRR